MADTKHTNDSKSGSQSGHGQGRVTDPKHDQRLKENRDGQQGDDMSSKSGNGKSSAKSGQMGDDKSMSGAKSHGGSSSAQKR